MALETGKPIEIVERPTQSNTLAAVAATLAGGAGIVAGWNAVNGVIDRLSNTNNGSSANGTTQVVTPTVIPMPMVTPTGYSVFQSEGASPSNALVDAKVTIAKLEAEKYSDRKAEAMGDKYLTKTEAMLLVENSQLKAEKYTDKKAGELKDEICELKKVIAVNAANDISFRKYVNSEFVHQPKAHMKHRLIETTGECCGDCGRCSQRDNCSHHNH